MNIQKVKHFKSKGVSQAKDRCWLPDEEGRTGTTILEENTMQTLEGSRELGEHMRFYNLRMWCRKVYIILFCMLNFTTQLKQVKLLVWAKFLIAQVFLPLQGDIHSI